MEYRMQNPNVKKKDNTFIEVTKYSVQNDKKSFISLLESVGSAVLYGFCSTSMAFTNKAVITSFSFNFPFFIMSCQMSLCIIILEVGRLLHLTHIPKYSLKLGWTFAWPATFYALHSVTALHALGGMSIPMYAAVKRCAPIITLILSVVILKKKIPNLKIVTAVVLICVGCFLAGLGDLEFDTKAYAYGIFSVFVQGLYLTLAQRVLEDMSALDVLYINSYNSSPFFIILCLLFEIREVTQYNGFSDPAFVLCFGIQACMGILLNYSLFLCTAKNSALTTSLVGILKSVLQTVIGLFTFGGIKLNLTNAFGISLNLFGGILYSYSKYKQTIKDSNSIKPV
ncbi:UDP-galactose/UDP-glucose transporter 7-like isoform X2 [Stegodyphus dumicola]|uniref:UDP-galactose/UDP-glucose transporter 7-like isoform X2 n=1 Tax=Stegodyphus dumicola TaxID=202533 RepID=UPI0015B19C81|nr:UDP-galactose/UDP-glucose transporter 7-like isoform X2 [Stegodyphus dumicola]